MWNETLLTLAALTLGGSLAVVLFAVTARASRTRYAARWRSWVWALLCLRLAIPFSLLGGGETPRQAPIRLTVPEAPVIYEYEPAQTPAPTVTDVKPSSTGSADAEPSAAPTVPTQETKVSISVPQVVLVAWIVGMVVMAAWMLVSHMRFLRYIRRWSRPVEHGEVLAQYARLGGQMKLRRLPRLRTCTGLRAPMLAGAVRPVLLLPEGMEQDGALRCVLVHELTHYKRRDIWLKTLALLANIVHWFNPFMWYMVRLVERDTELACDEAALRQLPPEEHAVYGRAILNATEKLGVRSEELPPAGGMWRDKR